jgi:hypothetical protein
MVPRSVCFATCTATVTRWPRLSDQSLPATSPVSSRDPWAAQRWRPVERVRSKGPGVPLPTPPAFFARLRASPHSAGV